MKKTELFEARFFIPRRYSTPRFFSLTLTFLIEALLAKVAQPQFRHRH